MKSLLARVKRWLPARVGARYLQRSGPNLATLVAWNMLFSFFPIIILAALLASLIPAHGVGIGQDLTQAIAKALPGGNGAAVVKALKSFHHNSGLLLIVAVVGLLWSGSSLFGAMDQAFASLSQTPTRSFIPQKLMSFGMIVLFACLLVLVVLSSSLLAVIKSLPAIPSLLTHGPAGLIFQIVLAIVAGTILFGAIYFLVPKARRHPRTVIPGALTAAVLFEALSLIFPLYFKLAHGFRTYGTSFSLFFLILAYAFLLAQITVIGFAVVLEGEPQPQPGTTEGEGHIDAGSTERVGEGAAESSVRAAR
ncbi:MAG: YihY/virulence factor BrkB family protein [Candidatus Dormiibacterota bacterium]